ncbi:MAG: hypothetical protein ABIQ81_02520 [Novosphingobium sp.]
MRFHRPAPFGDTAVGRVFCRMEASFAPFDAAMHLMREVHHAVALVRQLSETLERTENQPGVRVILSFPIDN